MNNKFYLECASILSNIQEAKTTLKTEVYKKKNPKKYMALLSQIIKYQKDYQTIITELNYKTKNNFLSLIYVHEILNKNITVNNQITKTIMKLGLNINRTLNIKTFYFRCNNNVNIDFLNTFPNETTFIKNVYKTKYNIVDTDFFRNGKIVIQNISSCLPAYFMNLKKNSKVIDCNAAPGNKTSQLSMLMENTGSIVAYEKDSLRFKMLEENMKKYGCTNTETINKDFLDVCVDSEAEYLLVDPSCSGSGIHDLYVKDEVRIKKLATFQKKILMHAMRFKNAKIITYSTCSVHVEENEEVIEYALENNKKFRLKNVEMDENITMLKFGDPKYAFYKDVVRVEIDRENNIHGFFTAVFVRNE